MFSNCLKFLKFCTEDQGQAMEIARDWCQYSIKGQALPLGRLPPKSRGLLDAMAPDTFLFRIGKPTFLLFCMSMPNFFFDFLDFLSLFRISMPTLSRNWRRKFSLRMPPLAAIWVYGIKKAKTSSIDWFY